MQTYKPFFLFFSPVWHAKAAFEELHEVASVELVTSTNRQEFFKDVEDKYKDIQVIYRNSASGTVSLPVLMCFIRLLKVYRSRETLTSNFLNIFRTCKFTWHNGAGE